MTRTMQIFLTEAARCEEGKGLLVPRTERRIASKAVRDGYGWMITAPLPIFIIDAKGRAALKTAEAGE